MPKKNRFECPKCGAKTEVVYESSDGRTIGIKCRLPHTYTKRRVSGDTTIFKYNEVFLIGLNERERELYLKKELRVGFRDYIIPDAIKDTSLY